MAGVHRVYLFLLLITSVLNIEARSIASHYSSHSHSSYDNSPGSVRKPTSHATTQIHEVPSNPSNDVHVSDDHVSDNHNYTVHHHHHYLYRPPSTPIYYTPNGDQPDGYPVYRGDLPIYVYEYKESENKYRNLLAGLALYNLGLVSQNHRDKHYTPKKLEICKFRVRYDNGNYEEMKIDCEMMSNFIWEEENSKNSNTRTMSIVEEQGYPLLLPNGSIATPQVTNATLVPIPIPSAMDARFKGDSVQTTPNMKCYVIRTTLYSEMQKSIPCGLLQTYTEQSLHKNSAFISQPSLYIIAAGFSFTMY